MNLGGNQEEFWLIFWLQRCICPYSSSGTTNTRNAAQRAEVLTYIFVCFLCWKEVWKRHRAGWVPGTPLTPRWFPSQCCQTPVPTSSWCRGSAGSVCGVGRPPRSCVLGEQNFIGMSWKEHASLPPVLAVWSLQVDRDKPGRHRAQQPGGGGKDKVGEPHLPEQICGQCFPHCSAVFGPPLPTHAFPYKLGRV